MGALVVNFALDTVMSRSVTAPCEKDGTIGSTTSARDQSLSFEERKILLYASDVEQTDSLLQDPESLHATRDAYSENARACLQSSISQIPA